MGGWPGSHGSKSNDEKGVPQVSLETWEGTESSPTMSASTTLPETGVEKRKIAPDFALIFDCNRALSLPGTRQRRREHRAGTGRNSSTIFNRVLRPVLERQSRRNSSG
jgi:hypothetical protein